MKLASSLILVATTFEALISPCSGATSLTFSEYVQMGFSWPHKRVPKWNNGVLIDVQGDHTTQPLIWIAGRQGTHSVPFAIQGSQWMAIYDWDRGADGTVGLTGSAMDGDGRVSGFVAWISSDEKTSNIAQTLLYRPSQVAVADDGTLWTSGLEPMANDPSNLMPQAGIIRHFGRSGAVLGSFVPQSTVAKSQALLSPANQIRVSSGRVAWYSPVTGRLIELSTNGTTLADLIIPPPGGTSAQVGGFALTASGDVFISAAWHATPAQGAMGAFAIFILDRSATTWVPVLQRATQAGTRSGPADFGHIYGVDGSRLVVNVLGNGLNFYNIVP